MFGMGSTDIDLTYKAKHLVVRLITDIAIVNNQEDKLARFLDGKDKRKLSSKKQIASMYKHTNHESPNDVGLNYCNMLQIFDVKSPTFEKAYLRACQYFRDMMTDRLVSPNDKVDVVSVAIVMAMNYVHLNGRVSEEDMLLISNCVISGAKLDRYTGIDDEDDEDDDYEESDSDSEDSEEADETEETDSDSDKEDEIEEEIEEEEEIEVEDKSRLNVF